MRRLQIKHLTVYQFSSPVTLEPHRLLLRPREGYDVRVEFSKLDISPAHHIEWHRDVFGNSMAIVSFTETSKRLTIDSEVIIQHYDKEPLDFLVEDYAVHYPFKYCEEEQIDLAPFQQLIYPDQQPMLRDWLQELDCVQKGVETYVLLDRINRAIAGNFEYVIREEPGVQSPAKTLESRSGSCRDYTTLFIEACRYLGLASRFVSGYSYVQASEDHSVTTHAWAQIYLPGPGWKGFDPTAGELTGNRYIPVAVARHPETVPPVAGSFIGSKEEKPVLTVDVRVKEV